MNQPLAKLRHSALSGCKTRFRKYIRFRCIFKKLLKENDNE
jgi:hypothetical protein